MDPRKPIFACRYLAFCIISPWFSLTCAGGEPPIAQASVGEEQPITETASEKDSSPDPSDLYSTVRIRGRVDWLSNVLKERFHISVVPESHERVLALVAEDEQVYPLVENIRGRAFRTDERLRNQDMEITVRKHVKQPFVQVLRIVQLEAEKRFEIDYWCDVCAITMFETGPCACCQDQNRLRKREVSDSPQVP
ncbi:MAG: hypothetical protein KDB03_02790 [Planctomycetales bacterium]|nr:hypothetical protein [Planctomycetales bacterium]